MQLINNLWVEELFQNDTFRLRLKHFIENPPSPQYQALDEKMMLQINSASEEVSGMIAEVISKESQKRFDLVAQQISKINGEIANLRNVAFAGNEKIALETTYYNKSRLQISSILDHDIGFDIADVKSSLVEMQQRFNEWFGGKNLFEQFSTADNLSQSKIFQLISKKCTQQIQLTQKRILKRFETTDLLTEKRIQQVSRTMKNVLQMLNEAHNKNNELKDLSQNDSLKQPALNQPSLIRQSSLQNLKIKSFFNFGHK